MASWTSCAGGPWFPFEGTSDITRSSSWWPRAASCCPIPPRRAGCPQPCLNHLETADRRAADDPSGSTLLYDAAPQGRRRPHAVDGLRATNRPGAHVAVVTYAEVELSAVLAAAHLAHLDRMRRTRNDAEYEERPVSERVRHDLAHARAMVQAIARTPLPAATGPAGPLTVSFPVGPPGWGEAGGRCHARCRPGRPRRGRRAPRPPSPW